VVRDRLQFGWPDEFRAVTTAGLSFEPHGGRTPLGRSEGVTAAKIDAATQAWNDDPQPQVPVTFGLLNLKPAPCALST